MYQLFVGLFAEGSTDERFLQSIIQRTLESIAFNECHGSFEIEVNIININKTGKGFVDQVLEVSKKGVENFGMMFLCLHRDADSFSTEHTMQYLINPAIRSLQEQTDDFCKIITPVIPVQETEAWMLADKTLFKRQIGAERKTEGELGISELPEDMSNPKEKIEAAIRIARQHFTKRRRQSLSISDLYLPIGQTLEIEHLERLRSFQEFKDNVRNAFRMLNLLRN